MASIPRQISRLLVKGLIFPIRFYQLCISPMFPGSCRFTPTCSQYAVEALRVHGPLKGLWLATRRILRCHPWGGSGYDPVPSRHVIDAHTHRVTPSPTAIQSLTPAQFIALDKKERQFCSVGIHPWETDDNPEVQFTQLERIIHDPAIIAVGECGLDRIKGATIDRQEQIFRNHILLSEQTRKPLVIHLVKALDLLLKALKKTAPLQPWILHGFRGNPRILSQLLEAEQSNRLYFSIGEKFNPETVALIPPDRLLVETDESPLSPMEIVNRIAHARGANPGKLAAMVNDNALRLFPALKGMDGKEKILTYGEDSK